MPFGYVSHVQEVGLPAILVHSEFWTAAVLQGGEPIYEYGILKILFKALPR